MTPTTPGNNPPYAPDQPGGDFDRIRELTRVEARAVDQLILRELESDVLLINQIGSYIVNSGGKRLRPMLLLLAAKSLQYQGDHHLTLAAVIEFIHTATLLHDDVVDQSDLRRGHESVNAVWGNAASVLVGDYLYSRAFQMMVRVGELRVMEILSQTTTAIAEGEVLQLLNCNNPETNEQRYLEVISRKTAILFSAATQLGAVIAGATAEVEEAMQAYGLHLGTAFQLIDDALDYKADPEELGKNLGDDLAEGKPTLPLIYAMRHTTAGNSAVIENAIREGNREAFAEVHQIIESTHAIEYTERRAKTEAQEAINALASVEDSVCKQAMVSLAHFSVRRRY